LQLNATDISELHLSKSTTIEFPNGKDELLNFNVTIKPEEGFHKYALALNVG
jgi:ubiquitin-conjugating enzyme E2 M